MEGRETRIICVWVRALRGRGADEDGLLARPERPRRCTLPITALRVMPPSSAAIWLADSPSPHSFFRLSTRSSVQVMPLPSAVRRRISLDGIHPRVRPARRPTRRYAPQPMNSETCPPHEMSYLTIKKLQYGGSRAQESVLPASTLSESDCAGIHIYLQTCGERCRPGVSLPGAHRRC